MRNLSQINIQGKYMNEISIVSSDARYAAVNSMLNQNGFVSRICTPSTVGSPDALILPIKSTLSDEEFSTIFQGVKESAFVFCADRDKVRRFFGGRIIDYSQNEEFLDKNAYITAECAVMIIMDRLKKTLSQSSVAVIGYGRIGKHLCTVLKALGASVTVFARREESRISAIERGCTAYPISSLTKRYYDAVLNTAPSPIISRAESEKISKQSLVIDLASLPGGFEDSDFPERALGLPGKMKPESAGMAIFDFVYEYISNEGN